MGAPAASQQAIERAIAAAASCGLIVTGFTVHKDGAIDVRTGQPAPVDSPPARVTNKKPKAWNREG